MGQTVCRYEYVGVKATTTSRATARPASTATTAYPWHWTCNFQVFDVVDQLANNPLWNFVILAVSLVLVVSLWILTAVIRFKDHTKSYVVSNLVPLTVYVVAALLPILNRILPFRIEPVSNYADTVRSIVFPIFVMNFLLSTILFLLMNAKVARSREKVSCSWVWFLLLFIFSAVAYPLIFLTREFSYTFRDVYIWLTYALTVILVVLIVLMALTSCCCCTSSPRIGQSPDPPVSNACYRYGWSLLFALVATAPVAVSLAANASRLFYHQLEDIATTPLVDDINQIAVNLGPLVFTLAVILLLPAYRSALFCSQGYGSGKIGIVEAKPIRADTPPAKPSAPAASPPTSQQNLSVPPVAQTHSPYLNTPRPGPVPMMHQDFGAVLTNPPNATFYSQPSVQPLPIQSAYPTLISAAPAPQPQIYSQPMVNPAPIMQAVPQPVYVAPSNVIPAEQYHLVPSQPSLMTQHHVVSTPAPALTHHLITPAPVAPQFVGTPVAPANLMRFASQPNLTAMTSLQPAVSTPQLNFVTHSPFYIPN